MADQLQSDEEIARYLQEQVMSLLPPIFSGNGPPLNSEYSKSQPHWEISEGNSVFRAVGCNLFNKWTKEKVTEETFKFEVQQYYNA